MKILTKLAFLTLTGFSLAACGGGGGGTATNGDATVSCKATSLTAAECNGQAVSLGDIESVKDNGDGTFSVVFNGETWTVKPDNYASDMILDVFVAQGKGIIGADVTIVVADGFTHSKAEMSPGVYHGDVVKDIVTTIAPGANTWKLDLGDLSNAQGKLIADINTYDGTDNEADIYNLSIGSYLSTDGFLNTDDISVYHDDSIKAVAPKTHAAFVVSAGNDAQGTILADNTNDGIAKDCSILSKCNTIAVGLIANGLAEQTVVVGAVDHEGNMKSYSTKAGKLKDHYIVAPVASEYEGTSFAAPVVSGVLGLIMDNQNNVDGAAAIDRMFATADDIGAPGIDDVYGNGRLNVGAALSPVGGLN